MFDAIAIALETGMGLKREHQRVLIRVGWVLGVSFHIAWVCGLTAVVGLSTPFARAGDVEKLMRAAEVNARISMQQELRVQTRLWCTTQDPEIRSVAYRRIDELRHDLFEIAKTSTPEPTCSKPAEQQYDQQPREYAQ